MTDFCSAHEKMIEAVEEIKVVSAVVLTKIEAIDVRINGSIKSIERHIDHGHGWRLGIIAVAVSVLLQLCGFIYFYGQLNKQVVVNTERLSGLESIHPRGEAYGKGKA